MSQRYLTPAATVETETEVKKSRFIARAAYVTSRERALEFLAQAKQDYPDARHHCWAYLIGNPGGVCSAAQNDDGEPGGTAGKPILNVIQHKCIGDVMLVVIRYFGGIKLGAGGLTRAYSKAAESVLSIMELREQCPKAQVVLNCQFSQEQQLRHWASQHGASIESANYAQDVRLELVLPEEHSVDLQELCAANGIEYEWQDE